MIRFTRRITQALPTLSPMIGASSVRRRRQRRSGFVNGNVLVRLDLNGTVSDVTIQLTFARGGIDLLNLVAGRIGFLKKE